MGCVKPFERVGARGLFQTTRLRQTQRGGKHAIRRALMITDHHVFDDGHVFKEAQILKRARQAERGALVRRESAKRFSVKTRVAARGRVNAGNEIEQRRLARAVRSDERDDFVRFHRERNIIDGENAAECFGEMFDLEKGHEER